MLVDGGCFVLPWRVAEVKWWLQLAAAERVSRVRDQAGLVIVRAFALP